MKLSLFLKSSCLFVACGFVSSTGFSQLYQVGNKVGIGISTPSGNLEIRESAGIAGTGLGNVPQLRFSTNTQTADLYQWDMQQDFGSQLHFYYNKNGGTPIKRFTLTKDYVQVMGKLLVNDFGHFGEVMTPNGATGYVLSLGLKEFGVSGAWNGSGAALFATNSGEFLVMTNPSGTVSGTTNMLNQVRFTANANGITVRKDPSKTFVDLAFIDPAQSGSDKRAFTIRAVGANHPTSANILEFWDPNNNGQTFFTMPVRIGGPASDISVTASGYDLYVAGGVRATTVKVDAYSNWPDYVFEKSYELMSLTETEEYMDANSHLPGVPSAAEVTKDGIELAEMNAILLQKMEELTLHLIEMQKQVNQLQNDQ